MWQTLADFGSMIGTVARPVTLQEELCYATFGEMYHTQVQTGHLSDDVLLAAGFACDRGLQEQETYRLAGVERESGQRAKCLSSQYQRDLRQRRVLDAQAIQRAAVAKKMHKQDCLVALNVACEEKLRALAAAGPYNLEQLAICKAQELMAFVHVRTSKWVTGTTSGKINKGTVASATSGTDCLILCAFKVQGSPMVLEKPSDAVQALSAPVHLEPTLVFNTSDAPPTVLALLEDDAWVAVAALAFAEPIHDPQRDSTRADLLAKHLRERLDRHLLTKVYDADTRLHPVWRFVRENIANVAALIEVQGHARVDMESASHTSELLRGSDAFVSCAAGPMSQLCGAYLYYDRAAWV